MRKNQVVTLAFKEVQLPEPTPEEREAEERWIEEQHRKHAPLMVRLKGWFRRLTR